MATHLAQGTTITVDDGIGGAIAIGGVTAIGAIDSGEVDEIVTTNLASSAHESRPGLQDFGTITVDMDRDNDNVGQAELLAIKATQTSREFIITLSGGTADVATFTGYVKSLPTEVGTNDILRGTATIRISGAIVWS